jgi:hypothetical protein
VGVDRGAILSRSGDEAPGHPGDSLGHRVPESAGFSLSSTPTGRHEEGGKERNMGILWIILIVVLVLALLGFFSRGYW